ncbi:MAG TPA: antitoxin family protein [Gemmataceae bacterium]|jgi:predicted DNA-binding antitoxin AbrB/MazE fold protein|nr:antitoxin family protein [Gemmataceae bacterium]
MTPLVVEATYENGVLKLDQPLPLKEHERVTVTLHTAVSRVRQTYGLLGWTGDAETVERVALDPEFGILESP